jgi:hypothetical protein
MHARLLALSCLLVVSASIGHSESIPPASDVSVYLKTARSTSPAVLDEMKTELASLMQGVHLEWRSLTGSPSETGSGSAVVVELRGTCSIPWHGDETQPVKNGAPLASTAAVDGYVLSFSWVDCATLSRLLGPSLADQPGALRDFIYGRAVARLLAHELYHVLLQTTGHAQTGIAKPQLTAAELLSERFPLEGFARKSVPAPAAFAPTADDLDDRAVGK